MPELRARQTSLRHQAQALDAQLTDREVYLKLAENLEDFLATLRRSATTAATADVSASCACSSRKSSSVPARS